jgi:hypothetical protein
VRERSVFVALEPNARSTIFKDAAAEVARMVRKYSVVTFLLHSIQHEATLHSVGHRGAQQNTVELVYVSMIVISTLLRSYAQMYHASSATFCSVVRQRCKSCCYVLTHCVHLALAAFMYIITVGPELDCKLPQLTTVHASSLAPKRA